MVFCWQHSNEGFLQLCVATHYLVCYMRSLVQCFSIFSDSRHTKVEWKIRETWIECKKVSRNNKNNFLCKIPKMFSKFLNLCFATLKLRNTGLVCREQNFSWQGVPLHFLNFFTVPLSKKRLRITDLVCHELKRLRNTALIVKFKISWNFTFRIFYQY